jgi:hypothetical protein
VFLFLPLVSYLPRLNSVSWEMILFTFF